MTNSESGRDISITVRPRRFIESIALPLLPRMRLYDPSRKPRGLKRVKRKLAQCADAFVHGWLKIPARGVLVVRRADGTSGSFEFDAHQSAYLAFASRAFQGGYEPIETMFIDAMLARSLVFHDVGANWGYYTLLAATHPEFAGGIYAFDISHRMNADLTRLAETLELGQVEVMGYGLSSRSGSVLTSGDRATHLTTIVNRTDEAAVRGARALVNRLDDVALPPPDLMKIDVEDHEREVLEGSRRILRESRPLILFECRNVGGDAETWELLRSHGYAFYSLNRRPGEETVLDLRPIDPTNKTSTIGPSNVIAVATGEEARWFG